MDMKNGQSRFRVLPIGLSDQLMRFAHNDSS